MNTIPFAKNNKASPFSTHRQNVATRDSQLLDSTQAPNYNVTSVTCHKEYITQWNKLFGIGCYSYTGCPRNRRACAFMSGDN